MPTYFIDYDDNSNWARIGALKLGDTCRVMVRQEENRAAPSISATGTRQHDDEFVVSVSEGDETFKFEDAYTSVMHTLGVFRDRRIK
jgi:hypothetical protein